MSLNARISAYSEPGENRASRRRTLHLHVAARGPGDATEALIHNLSQHGLLLQTSMPLSPGDALVIDLPEAEGSVAEVVWARDGLAGCEFEIPLRPAAVSAGLLRSEPRPRPDPVPIAAAAWQEGEACLPGARSPVSQAMLTIGLLVSLVVAAMFVIALLTVPFAAD